MNTTTQVEPIRPPVSAFSITYNDKNLTMPEDRDQMEITDGASFISNGTLDIYPGYVIVTQDGKEYEIALDEIESIVSLENEVLYGDPT